MKKNSIYALMSAIALAGSVGFSSCSSTEDQAEVNPGYNPDTGEVPVSFVINISTTDNTSSTRMTAGNTQAVLNSTNKFRGIGVSHLMAFDIPESNGGMHVYGTTLPAPTKEFELGTILERDAIDPNSATKTKSHRILELAVPVNTDCIMFWGKAIKNGTDFEQGKVVMNIDNTNISNSSISLVPCISTDASDTYNQAAFEEYKTLMATALTKIVQTELTGTELNQSFTDESGTHSGTLTQLKWSDYVAVDDTDASNKKLVKKTKDPSDANKSMGALGEILADAFVKLNTIKKNELRAGSADAVQRTFGDLYSTIKHVGDATPTSLEEKYAQVLGAKIESNINKAFKDAGTNCKWQTLANVREFTGLTAAKVQDDLSSFPGNFNIPEGGSLLTFDVVNFAYSYRSNVPTYDMGGAEDVYFDIYKYMLPAELCYFGNSPIRVTTQQHLQADYPDGVGNWDNDAQWAAGVNSNTVAWTKNGRVTSATNSVAMQENINYGSALLKATVKYGAASLKDNNKAIQALNGIDEEDNVIDVTKAGQFQLTGILVGGQEQTMGWNYLAKAATPTFDCMIYDKDIVSSTIPAWSTTNGYADKSDPNYTLVWDNWINNETQQTVYIALEFKNNAGDFWGQNNMIRNGGTFYITAKLDPAAGSTTNLKWPMERGGASEGTTGSPYALPPYDADGKTIKKPRVFIQDYLTEANFTIGENSLKKALVAVPDLRTAQMSLGLSVDLNWSTGMSFDVELGNVTPGGSGARAVK